MAEQKKTNEEIVTALEALFDGEQGADTALAPPTTPATADSRAMSDSELRALGRRLAEDGDPGEQLVEILRQRSEDPDVRAREAELVAWLGDELAYVAQSGGAEFTWRDGLLDGFASGDVECGHCGVALAQVLSAPCARFLSELTLWGSVEEFVPAVVEHGVPEHLERLTLFESDPHELHATMNILRHVGAAPPLDPEVAARVPGNLGSLRDAYPALASLRELSIYAGGIDFDAIDLPALEVAELHTDFTSAQLAAIGGAHWPSLTRLDLRFGVNVGRGGYDVVDCDERGCAACEPDDLAAIFQGDATPVLESLALVGLSFADDVVAKIVRAPIVTRLRELDLSKGLLTDEGALQLAAARDALAHLERLDVTDNRLSPEAAASLAAALPNAIVEPQFEAESEDDDA